MPLVVATLAAAIEEISQIDIDSGPITNEEAAMKLALAIDAYIRTGTTIVTGGSSAGAYPMV